MRLTAPHSLLRPKTGRCPMTGHRLSQGWSPHMGRPISVRWLSHDRSSYSTNFRPKTDRSDQSDLISGRRLTAAKKCLSEITFRNLNNVMYKIRFCGYHWLLLYKEFPQSKPIMSEIIENLRRSGSELDGVATFQSTNIFLDILSNHSCSGHSCKCLFVWTWSFWHAAYSRTMHVLFHYRLLIKFNVLFTRFDPETGLWKFAPVKTTVAHRTASLRTVASQACPSSRIRGWYGRRSVATLIRTGRVYMVSQENAPRQTLSQENVSFPNMHSPKQTGLRLSY